MVNRASIINGNMKSLTMCIILMLITCSALFGFFAWRDSIQASVRLEWATASEIDTAGFNIYRSEAAGYGFELVNTGIIPASQDPLIGATYYFIDDNVVPGKTYYYLLEDVGMNGQANRTEPIEIVAQADYWINLTVSVLSIGLALMLMLNKLWISRYSTEKKA